jgi:hypothetical protein
MQNNFNGCIIFAYNTDKIDYFNQAVEAADRVVHYLNLPVTIFTNEERKCKHNVIITEIPPKNYKQRNIWYNRSRTGAFDLTPYSKTLVIDGDYFLLTDTLKYHIDSQSPFLITQQVYNPKTGQKNTFNLGKTHIPMMWATVMIFDKSQESFQIFEMAKIIENHYHYYSNLYGFHHAIMRNDYIFSIACHIMGGYGRKSYAIKNYPLVNCSSEISYHSWDNNKLVYKYDSGKVFGNFLKNIDLHLMNKGQL